VTAGPTTGIIIVDHGSRRAQSNEALVAAARRFAEVSEFTIVELAHMELVQPDVAAAFDRCVQQGAERIVVFPYFLSPGRHWKHDIPDLVAAAAKSHPEATWIVTAPFGIHDAMMQVIRERIDEALGSSAAS